MTDITDQQPIEFILAVTGHTEVKCAARIVRKSLPNLPRRVEVDVVRRVPQRPRIRLRNKTPTRSQIIPDHQKLALDLPKLLAQNPDRYFLWLDDLEKGEDRQNPTSHYRYYRDLIEGAVTGDFRRRCSVHFLVNMLENYFFGHTSVVNEVLKTSLTDHDGDCENIRSAAGKLNEFAKSVSQSSQYHKTTHGTEIARKLDIERILGNPQTCRALRTLVAWCWNTVGEQPTGRFQLAEGSFWSITAVQLSPEPNSDRCLELDKKETGYRPLA